MPSRRSMVRMIALAILASVLLGACGPDASPNAAQLATRGVTTSATSIVNSIARPTAAQAIAPRPTAAMVTSTPANPSAGVAAPTSAPAPTALAELAPDHVPCSSLEIESLKAQLPAPLYFFDDGEIARLERDGVACTHVTRVRALGAAETVLFDVSPHDGALVYLFDGAGCQRCLVQTDAMGQNPLLLLDTASWISAPRWSPDGAQIAVAITRGESGDLDDGIYLIPNGGGAAQRVLSTTYQPRLWSPDGSRLLLQQTDPTDSSKQGLAIYHIASGQLIPLVLPVTRPHDSREGDFFTWSADSRILYSMLQPYRPEVWRFDTTSGVLEPFLAGLSGDGMSTLAAGLSMADGWIYTFLAAAPPLQHPLTPLDELPQYAMYRVSADGAKREQLLPATFRLGYGGIFWAPDHSGALAILSEHDLNTGTLFWVPADGQPPVQLNRGAELFRWGVLPNGAGPVPSIGAVRPTPPTMPSARPATATIAPATSDVMNRLSAPLAPDTAVFNFKLSPDGRYAVYVAQAINDSSNTLYIVPLQGGSAHGVGSLALWRGYQYSITADSQYVVYVTEQGVFSAPLSGGAARKLSEAITYQLSPDGRFVVVETSGDQPGHNILSSIPLDGRAPIRLAEGLGADGELGPYASNTGSTLPAWEAAYRLTPDGRSVVYRTREALFSVPITGGAPVKLSAALEPDTYIYGYTITPDGRLVIYDTRRLIEWGCPQTPSWGSGWVKITSIYSVPVSGGTPITLASAPDDSGIAHTYSFSFDGAQLFFSLYGTAPYCGMPSGVYAHYDVPTSGGTPTKRTNPPTLLLNGEPRDPRLFTQDGALYSQPDASKAPILLHDPTTMGNLAAESFSIYDDASYGEEHGYQLSPDGRSAVYRTHEGDLIASNLYRVALQGGAPLPLIGPLGPGGAIESVRISPDGRRVIYKAAQPPTFTFELYSVPIQGGAAVLLSLPLGPDGKLGDAQITADSRRVVYMAAYGRSPVFELYVTDIE